MTGRDQLLTLTRLFADALEIEQTTVSWRLFQDTNKLAAIEAGKDLYLGRYERALQYLSDHWPPSTEWPAAIKRPDPTPAAKRAEDAA